MNVVRPQEGLPPFPAESESPPAPPAPRVPTLTEALLLYAGLFALAVFPGSLLILVDTGRYPIGPLLNHLVLFLGPMLLAARLLHWDVRATFRLRRVPATAVLLAVVATFAFVPVAQEMEILLERLLPVPGFIEEFMRSLLTAQGPLDMGLTILAIGIVPGIVEETLFRGVILWGLLGRTTPVRAVLLTALLFGVMHLNPWQFLAGFVLGSIYGAIILWTGSILPAVVAHVLNNTAFVIISNTRLIDANPPPFTERALVLVPGLLVFLVCLRHLRRIGRTMKAGTPPAGAGPFAVGT
jgi:membrane protease YdiL (CAAX protease family)